MHIILFLQASAAGKGEEIIKVVVGQAHKKFMLAWKPSAQRNRPLDKPHILPRLFFTGAKAAQDDRSQAVDDGH